MMVRLGKCKDSGDRSIGELPRSWEVTSIKNVLEIPITDGPHTTPQLFDYGVPFISAEAVKKGKLDFNRMRGYISEEDYLEFSQKYSPKKGDVFMIKSGATTGNVAMVETDDKFAIWSPLAVFRSNESKVLSSFLHYYLGSPNFRSQVEINWSYGTQQNIGMGVLSNLKISYPSISEQTKIAQFLDHKTKIIDALIEKKEELIKKLEEQRQAIINETVTKGLNPNAKMKDSGVEWLGEIPEGWSIVPIRYLSNKVGSGVTPKGGAQVYQDSGILFIRSQNVYDDRLKLDDVSRISIEIHEKMSGSKVFLNDVLLNITGASIGRTSLYQINEEANVNQHVCIIRSNDKILPEYLHFVLQSEVGKLQVALGTTGGSREGLTFEAIKDFLIPLPSKEVQKSIMDSVKLELDSIQMIDSKLKIQIESLKKYRQSLISEAVTGKIDVRDWKPKQN